jgi:small-conductance mechanosensitive channel
MFITFDGFWENISRYPRYFISILLGVFFFTFGWLVPLFKRPVTALALIGFLGAAITFVVFTLRAMLGLSPI